MLYFNINYFIHSLLHSRHYKFIYLFIFVLVYTYLNFFNLSYCMMEEPGTPLSDISLEIEGENVPPYGPGHPLYVAPEPPEIPEYPETAEAKQELANQSPILQEIESYTASQEQLLKRLNDQADYYAQREKLMIDRIYELMNERSRLSLELYEEQMRVPRFLDERDELIDKAYADAYNNAYKTYMEHFKKNENR